RVLSPGWTELAAGAAALLPAMFAVRGPNLAEYHGAEHISIGTYEQDAPAPKEHPRCGTQLIAPLVVASMAANAAAATVPRPARGLARLVGTTVAVGASIEALSWTAQHPEHPVAKALERPGF